MEFLTDPEIWIAFATLTVLEIVLGIDNIVFLSILTDKLPEHQQEKARKLGLGLAMIMRILLLLSISWVIGLTDPIFTITSGKGEISGRDMILLAGGLFLIAKATFEIHERLEGQDGEKAKGKAATFGAVIAQIIALDLVFSLDSVITAVGTADEVGVMIAAVVVAVGVMFFAANAISGFVSQHPTVKMLALSFLVLIGFSLTAEAFDQHIPKGFIYFAIGFAVIVEGLNLRAKRARRHGEPPPEPVHLRDRFTGGHQKLGGQSAADVFRPRKGGGSGPAPGGAASAPPTV